MHSRTDSAQGGQYDQCCTRDTLELHTHKSYTWKLVYSIFVVLLITSPSPSPFLPPTLFLLRTDGRSSFCGGDPPSLLPPMLLQAVGEFPSDRCASHEETGREARHGLIAISLCYCTPASAQNTVVARPQPVLHVTEKLIACEQLERPVLYGCKCRFAHGGYCLQCAPLLAWTLIGPGLDAHNPLHAHIFALHRHLCIAAICTSCKFGGIGRHPHAC
jgi:hypothetical protein